MSIGGGERGRGWSTMVLSMESLGLKLAVSGLLLVVCIRDGLQFGTHQRRRRGIESTGSSGVCQRVLEKVQGVI